MTVAWSYSRLNKFRQCPRKSYCMDFAPKHEKIKEPDSPIFERGKRMHKAMEDAIQRAVPLPAGLVVPDKNGREEVLDLRHLQPIADAIRNSERIWVEEQMAFTEDLRMTSWFGDDVWCRVIWDAAGRIGTKVHMVDWKSGKPRPDSDQLELFAASVLTKLPEIEEVHTYFVFMEHRKYTHDVFYRGALPHIWQKFGEEVEQIIIARDTGNWEPCPGHHCKWCPVPKSKCSHSQVEG